MADRGDITQVLAAVRRGEKKALDELLPMIYDELREVARRQLRRRRPGQTINTTALVHEAYLKLVDQDQADFHDRSHFFAVAAVTMRHILVDYARRQLAKKRGGDQRRVTLDERRIGEHNRAIEVLALDEALTSLSEISERLTKLVELRFFGGLTVEETAGVMGISTRTVKRDWRKARAFLYQRLEEQAAP